MCPAPAKTSDTEIVDAARSIIVKQGATALSMQAVAELVGVRAPSLYKRFPNRDALLDAVAREALLELIARLRKASRAQRGRAALFAMARTYREFAKRSPERYRLLYTPRAEAADLVPLRARAVEPLLELLAEFVAPDDRSNAARLLTAFLHGFVTMEMDGAFKLGGDVAQAFEYGLHKLVDAAISG